MTRDQSEDRQQSRYIVFGKQTAGGVRYGVKTRLGEVLMINQTAAIATDWAVNQDKVDAANATRKAAMLAVTPEEDEAFRELSFNLRNQTV